MIPELIPLRNKLQYYGQVERGLANVIVARLSPADLAALTDMANERVVDLVRKHLNPHLTDLSPDKLVDQAPPVGEAVLNVDVAAEADDLGID